MRPAYNFLIALVFIISFSCKSSAQNGTSTSLEEQLADQSVLSVLWYQRSAEMKLAYYQAYTYARLLLNHKLETVKDGKTPAVVLDIDETVLDNSPYQSKLIENGKLYNSKSWMEWTALARAKALPGAYEFVKYAQSRGVEVYYISNRKVDELDATIQNLKKYNFPNADEAHVLLKESTSDKTERRARVTETNSILVFIGDQLTDYSQIYADRGADFGLEVLEKNRDDLLNNFVILPNPMYGEFEDAIYKNDHNLPLQEKLETREEALEKVY